MEGSSQGTTVFVSTALPPAVCGVGTHTAKLREYWPNGDRLLHLVDAGAADSSKWYGADDFVQFDRHAGSLRHQLEAAKAQRLLVQYAGRAYSRWGAPWWFYVALNRWRKQHPETTMLLYVHELWAELKWSHRQFVFERLSRWIMGRLMDMSDIVVTNTENHRERLNALRPGVEVMLVPVGTNIIPVAPPIGLKRRQGEKEFVLFGLAYSRLHTLKVFKDWLVKWHQSGILGRLHVIGPSEERWQQQEEQLLSLLPVEAVMRHGALPETEVSEILLRSGFGLMAQAPESMTKSGSLMAFLSHGCIVVCPHANGQMSEPIRWFVNPEELVVGVDLAEVVHERQLALMDWYERHATWPGITRTLADAMVKISRKEEAGS